LTVDPPNGSFPELTAKGKAILTTGKWSAAFPMKLDK
jgi:hypothetical protein